MPLNSNSARDYVNANSTKILVNQVHDYPHFFIGLRQTIFRGTYKEQYEVALEKNLQ